MIGETFFFLMQLCVLHLLHAITFKYIAFESELQFSVFKLSYLNLNYHFSVLNSIPRFRLPFFRSGMFLCLLFLYLISVSMPLRLKIFCWLSFISDLLTWEASVAFSPIYPIQTQLSHKTFYFQVIPRLAPPAVRVLTLVLTENIDSWTIGTTKRYNGEQRP